MNIITPVDGGSPRKMGSPFSPSVLAGQACLGPSAEASVIARGRLEARNDGGADKMLGICGWSTKTIFPHPVPTEEAQGCRRRMGPKKNEGQQGPQKTKSTPWAEEVPRLHCQEDPTCG